MTTATATVGQALSSAGHALTEAGIDSARLDARLLMGHALGLTPEQVFGNPERPLESAERELFDGLVEQRSRRQPLSQIVGHREFWSLNFTVTADTLTPRPDSETVIEEVLKSFPDTDAALDILDLGTGSGCLLLTLLNERPGASGTGIDISEAALDVARSNARDLGLAGRAKFIVADWMTGLGDKKFDVIVCNPPYIPETERDTLMPEVAMHEPDNALFAGVDGLDAYRALMPGLAGNLKSGGYVFFEVGAGQADAVGHMLEQAGFGNVGVGKDLSEIGRCVHGSL